MNTSVGRAIFNQAVPQDIGMVERKTVDDMFKLEVDTRVGKKELGQIISHVFAAHQANRTSEVLDEIKALGFKFATRGAITVGIKDASCAQGEISDSCRGGEGCTPHQPQLLSAA